LTLEDFNIPSNSTLQLIVKLCDVPDDLDELVFDFCWGLPRRQQKDYLDVSVFVYSGESNVGTISFKKCSIPDCPGVRHSGHARMDYEKGEGNHRVDISLKSVPRHIDKIVLTLSAWRSSSVSAYPFRRLRFYDVDFPDQELCNDDISGLLHNESIILCCLSRKEGKWSVFSLKCGAEGCTKNFTPLREKIQELIQRKTIK
jgi:stress response protein SCP2